jgi:hypothetical protein
MSPIWKEIHSLQEIGHNSCNMKVENDVILNFN